jgi:hypothetical protein
MTFSCPGKIIESGSPIDVMKLRISQMISWSPTVACIKGPGFWGLPRKTSPKPQKGMLLSGRDNDPTAAWRIRPTIATPYTPFESSC